MSLLTGGLVRMVRGMTERGLLVGSCLLAFLGTACTPATPPPAPPTTAAPTPSENAQEREQRLAYEAAETSYREFRAEFYRVLRAGGAKSATPKMRATATGPYLKEATEVVQAYSGEGGRSTGLPRVVSVRGDGYSVADLVLSVCDDTTKVRSFDKNGKEVGRGEFRASEITAHLIDGRWKLWSGTGKRVESCDV